jgi:hypothetical protein
MDVALVARAATAQSTMAAVHGDLVDTAGHLDLTAAA